MRRLARSVLLLTAVLLLPDLAPGQFGDQPSYGLVGTMLNLADVPGIRAELKATDDQVKALVAIRQGVWDKLYTRTPKELAKRIPAERPEVEAAVRKVVSPEQYTRLRQLAIRAQFGFDPLGDGMAAERAPRQLYDFGGSGVEEIRAALKIEAKQGPGGFPGMVPSLTFEQRQALKALMGPPFRGASSFVGPPGAYDERFSGFIEVPIELDFLDSPEVRKALGVPKAAEPKLAALLERWEKESQALGVGSYFLTTRMGLGSHGPGGPHLGPDLSLEQKKAKIDKLVADLRAEATALVGAAAMTRARQIGNYHAARMDGSPKVGVYNLSHLDDVLKLDRSQRDALQRLVSDEHVRAVAALVDLDRPDAAVLRDLAELDKTTVAKAEAILTAEQLARLKEQLGEPFDGELTFDYQAKHDGALGDPEAAKALAAASFGRWTAGELYALTQPAFQAELKLTDKEKEQADAAVRKHREELGFGGGFGPTPDGAAEKTDAFVRKQVEAILTPEQRARFLELAIQYRQALAKRKDEMPFTGNGRVMATGLPGVADKVGVTAEQKAALLDGKPEGNVLTDAQAKKLAELAGVPAKADLLAAGPGGGGGPGFVTIPRPYHLLLEPVHLGGGFGGFGGFGRSNDGVEVEEELKLSAEQRQELANLAERRTAGFKGLHRQGPDERKAAIDAANKADAAAIDKLLSAEQRKRLDQLALQAEAGTSLGAVLADLADLKLTAEQKAAIQTLREKARDRGKLLDGKVGTFPASTVVGKALRDKLDDALLKVLTPVQLARWQERAGPPAAGVRKQPVPIGGHGPGLGFARGMGEPALP